MYVVDITHKYDMCASFPEKFFQTKKAAGLQCPTMNNCSHGHPRNFPGAKGCVKVSDSDTRPVLSPPLENLYFFATTTGNI